MKPVSPAHSVTSLMASEPPGLRQPDINLINSVFLDPHMNSQSLLGVFYQFYFTLLISYDFCHSLIHRIRNFIPCDVN